MTNDIRPFIEKVLVETVKEFYNDDFPNIIDIHDLENMDDRSDPMDEEDPFNPYDYI